MLSQDPLRSVPYLAALCIDYENLKMIAFASNERYTDMFFFFLIKFGIRVEIVRVILVSCLTNSYHDRV